MLRPGVLKGVGIIAFIITAALLVIVFLVPYLILKKILSGLQETYQLKQENTDIWSNMPGGRDILYRKYIRFYNVSSESYYQIKGVNLIPAVNITLEKSTVLQDIKFVDHKVEATLNTTYKIPVDFKEEEILSRNLLQYRHGAFRAISEIERRPPT